MIGRLASLIFVIGYMIVAYFAVDEEPHFVASIEVLVFCVFPLACIWFSDTMGNFTGFLGIGPAITQTTPGCVVAFFG